MDKLLDSRNSAIPRLNAGVHYGAQLGSTSGLYGKISEASGRLHKKEPFLLALKKEVSECHMIFFMDELGFCGPPYS